MLENQCDGIVLIAGDSPAPTVNESMASIMQAMTQYLPDLMKVTNSQISPSEEAKLAASQSVSPGYAQLQTDLYGQYAPQLNKIASDVAKQNALAQAGSDLAVVSGPGRSLVREALATAKEGDPEYYATREALGKSYADLLSGLNPNGLSGGETEAINRSLAQQAAQRGTVSSPSQTETVSNAMNFGNALNDKKAKIAGILQGAANSLPAMKSGMDVFQVATGKSSMPNAGEAKTTNAMTGLGSSAEGMSSNLLSSATSANNAKISADAQRRDALDRVFQGMSTIGNVAGSYL